ncbi:MAG: MFS transporter [Acetobacteraceae bacterium]|nr:MFS transporter [Acetobacteraceae bacterium]
MSSPRAERALDVLNVVLADVRYGLGPYAAIFLMTRYGWDEASIAFAASFAGMTGLIAQTPIGALVDRVRSKRAVLACAVLVLAASCLMVVLLPRFWALAAAGVAGALAGSTIGTGLAAISLSIVGPERFARRAARNEALFHSGNAIVNLTILSVAPFFGIAAVFWALAAASLLSLGAIRAIPARAIDADLARGLSPNAMGCKSKPSAWRTVLGCRPLLVFGVCGALFHFANVSMIGLVVQRLTRRHPADSVPLAAACMIAAQIVMVAIASLSGSRADAWGRKPIFLSAFLVLALRGALYTVSDDPLWSIVVQLLDGVGVGVFGALFPVVIADLVRGSGHFNAAQGGVGTIHSIGGILSAPAANLIVVWAGYDAAFATQAAVALAGAALFWLAMPETRPRQAMRARFRRVPDSLSDGRTSPSG